MNFNEIDKILNEDILEEGVSKKFRAAVIGAATLIAAVTGISAKKAWNKAYDDYMNSRTDYYKLYKAETARVNKKAYEEAYRLYSSTRLPDEDIDGFQMRMPTTSETAEKILKGDIDVVQSNLDKFRDEQNAKHPIVSRLKPYDKLDVKNKYSYERNSLINNVENATFAGNVAGISVHKDSFNHGSESKFKDVKGKYTFPDDINGRVHDSLFNKKYDAKKAAKEMIRISKVLNKIGNSSKPYGLSAAVVARDLRNETYNTKDRRKRESIIKFVDSFDLNNFDEQKFSKEGKKLLDNFKSVSYDPEKPNEWY